MARIPEAVPGLVFRYRYLRVRDHREGRQVGKERPCCILIPLRSGQVIAGGTVFDEEGGRASAEHVATSGEVLIVLIQSDAPGPDQVGIELRLEEKRYVGLPDRLPSYAIVSEVNIDRWPNGDMCLLPGGQDRLAYDRPFARPTLSRLIKALLSVVERGKLQVLVRQM